MKYFALTGGIGSGKSAVSAMLQKAQIPVIDADVLARQVVEPGSIGLQKIIDFFGKEFLDTSGALNRKKMADQIFTDQVARQKLEDITHPLIAEQLRSELKKYEEKGAPYVVYEAPLIFEKGLQDFFTATILVTTNAALQEKRLMQRDQISLAEAQRRIKTQMPNAEKEKRTEFIIDNSGTLAQTQEKLQHVWYQLTKENLRVT